jgi:hypothetical protein
VTCKPGLPRKGTNITIIVKDEVEIHIKDFIYASKDKTDSTTDESYDINVKDWTKAPVEMEAAKPNLETVKAIINHKVSLDVSNPESGAPIINFNINNSNVRVNNNEDEMNEYQLTDNDIR